MKSPFTSSGGDVSGSVYFQMEKKSLETLQAALKFEEDERAFFLAALKRQRRSLENRPS